MRRPRRHRLSTHYRLRHHPVLSEGRIQRRSLPRELRRLEPAKPSAPSAQYGAELRELRMVRKEGGGLARRECCAEHWPRVEHGIQPARQDAVVLVEGRLVVRDVLLER